MPNLDILGFPGMRSTRVATSRVIKRNARFLDAGMSQGVRISGTASRDPGNTGDTNVLRPGLIMGKRSSDGLYAPSIIGVLVSGGTLGSTSLTFSSATATELVRRVGATGTFKLTGPPAAASAVVTAVVTYSNVNPGTGVVTVTALNNAFFAGSFMQPTDGSEVPVSFLPDGYGYNVFDQDGVPTDIPWPDLVVGATVDSTQLIPWPSDPSLQAWIMARLNAVGGNQFVFDNVY